MKIVTLKDEPIFFEKTMKLIEQCFNYEEENSFEIDFYPLIEDRNLENCFILIEDNEVLAHIGTLTKSFILNDNSYSFTMYGGIAVAKNRQGKGLFKKLFNYVLKEKAYSTFHLLWSEKVDLYEKFSFFPCIGLNQYSQADSPINSFEVETSYLIDLDSKDLEKVKSLYKCSNELRVHRNEKDWESLYNISSSTVYLIYQKDELINYFIKDKGQDLTDIIFEYGFIDSEQLDLMRNFGTVWSPEYFNDAESLYATLMKIGNIEKFKTFISEYCSINIKDIRESISFDFQDQSIELSIEEFLAGIFGPSRYEEINAPNILISGLDSI